MDSAVLLEFLTASENLLPTIRGGILVCAQEGNSYGALNASLRQVGSIKSAAEKLELNDVIEAAVELETSLSAFIASKQDLSDEQSRELLDKLTALEILLAQLRFGIDDSTVSVADFVEESFDNLWLNQKNPAAAKLPETPREIVKPFIEETASEDFEIDEEMLEIFALEAEELIQSIGDNLQILEETPNNREALLEIRRNAHTLKGSAGIVGLNQLSKVAHRVEDFLDYVADNDIEATEKMLPLLLTATDCFSAVASGENSPHLAQKINRLYEDLDTVLAALKSGDANEQKISETIELELETVAPKIAPVQETTNSEDEATENAAAQQSNQPRSIVRVSLEKLDDLVKIIGGLVVSRSVFEQRLTELEQQIGEIHNSTRRLQQSTNKLETNFEANMLKTQNPRAANNWQLAQTIFDVRRPTLGANAAPAAPDANVFDTLELDRYTDFHQTMRELTETTSDTSAINSELDNLHANLELLFSTQRRLIEDMQDKILRLRLVTFGAMSVRLQRTIRVACDEENKLAELIIEGENLEVDTQILDSLTEPLLHLLRNAVAHGIEPPETRRLLGKPETGKITVRAKSEGTHIILKISDDGRGIFADGLKEKALRNSLITREVADTMSDEEAFSLIFLPGLTTTGKVSQISGRGVGMNIVKQSIERQQGTISIDSETHHGTTFTLRLPMALAVTRVLLVKTNEQTFAFPLKIIKQAIEISAADLQTAKEKNGLTIAGANYALVHLSEMLNLPAPNFSTDETVPVLLLEMSGKPCALVVGEIIKSEEIVIKPLGNPLQNLAEMLGATILGNGSIVPVLDLLYLLERKLSNGDAKTAVRTSETSERTAKSTSRSVTETQSAALNVMIVDDSPSVRHLTSNIIKKAGWNAILAKDGLEGLEILQDLREMPDIILSDVEMPRMDGYEFLASLKRQENLQAIPVVMITSRANQKHRQKAFDLGVSEHLIKPFDDAKLIETIKNLIA